MRLLVGDLDFLLTANSQVGASNAIYPPRDELQGDRRRGRHQLPVEVDEAARDNTDFDGNPTRFVFVLGRRARNSNGRLVRIRWIFIQCILALSQLSWGF